MTLVERKSKYIVPFKASGKRQYIKDGTLNWLNEQTDSKIKIPTFEREKEFSK